MPDKKKSKYKSILELDFIYSNLTGIALITDLLAIYFLT